MLVLKLYEGCRLNEKYEEVFSMGKLQFHDKTIFQEYLDTLNSFVIELDSVYYENEGTLILDNIINEKNIYEYNYMEVTLLDDEEEIVWKRYCFVKSIKIKNNCIYLDYKEDIWHSYNKGAIGFNNSLLSGTRVKEYPNLTPKILKLPIPYDGNNPLNIIPLEELSYDTVYIILEVQYYKLGTASTDYIDRTISNIVLTKYHEDQYQAQDLTTHKLITADSLKFSYRDACDLLKELIERMANGNAIDGRDYIYSSTQNPYELKYEIGNIYFIPGSFEIEIENNTNAVTFVKDNGLAQYHQYESYAYGLKLISTSLGNYGEEKIVYEKEFDDDYKDVSVGTFNNSIELIHNGTSHTLKVSMMFSINEISILMNIDNQVYDITIDFSYEMPFRPLHPEEYAQRLVTYQIKRTNNEFAIFKDILGISRGANKFAAGMMQSIQSDGKSGQYQAMEGIHDALESGMAINKDLTLGKLYNASMYSNGKGIYNNSNNMRNSIFGLCLFSIEPDNEEIVKIARNKYGYSTCELVNDYATLSINNALLFAFDNIKYNFIRLQESNIYGSFTNEIAEKLNEILENGIRVWYTSTPEEDNYGI